MGKKSSLSENKRAKIVTLFNEGYSERQISVKVSCSKTAVHTAIVNFKTSGSFRDKKRCGRPRKTSLRDDHLIKRIATRSPTSSCGKIRAAVLQTGTDISSMTVSRRLRFECGLKSYKPARKPRLTAVMKSKRLAFAKKHETWTAEDWSRVMFSDESTLQQFVTRKRHIRRPPGKRFEDRYTIQTMKHPPSQMIWGAMSKSGTAGLYFLPQGTTMNGAKYVELLREKLKLHMYIHQCSIFMHDGAPCHRSKVVQNFLAKIKVSTLDWPGNSPDLNPIENLWEIVKKKVADKQPSSIESLKEAIKEVWIKEISAEYCNNLILSMPRRIQAVIKSKGGHTKY